jgi:hypothetical protein
MAQVVECLPSKALSSNPSTTKQTNKQTKKKLNPKTKALFGKHS